MMPTSDDETTVAPLQEKIRKEPNLTSQERRDIVQAFFFTAVPGDAELKLVSGAIKSVSDTYHVIQKTIRKIWQSLVSSPKIQGNSGRPQKWVRQDVCDLVVLLPLNQRRTSHQIDCIGVGDSEIYVVYDEEETCTIW
jgi:hypothetical protein